MSLLLLQTFPKLQGVITVLFLLGVLYTEFSVFNILKCFFIALYEYALYTLGNKLEYGYVFFQIYCYDLFQEGALSP